MLMRFVPAALTCSSIVVCAPLPSATIVMTAPTPMIMPSMVSTVRRLLRLSALSAIRSVINRDIRVLLHHAADVLDRFLVRRRFVDFRFRRRKRGELLGCHAPLRDLLIDLNLAVAEANEPG